MHEYSHLVNSRARHKELMKDAMQARLGNQIRARNNNSSLPVARTTGTIVAFLMAMLPWLRRG